jgi:UDP-glucose 4-epimerase
MNLSGKRILVTGAAGFIGSHLSERLASLAELVLVDNFSVGSRENLVGLAGLQHVRVVEADIRDRERMHALCEGINVVFHLAVSCLRTSLAHPERSHDVNAGGTLATCLAARDRDVERFVYVSSSEVYGTARTAPMAETHPLAPTTVYGASKLAGELYALACHRTWDLPVVVARPFSTYGPREPWQGVRAEVIPRFLLRLEAGFPPIIYGDGRQTRDFTYVDDTVAGLIAAAESDALLGESINIAHGREVSILRIAELLSHLCPRGRGRVDYQDRRPGDVERHWADISKAQRLLGFTPRVELEEGLARTLEWFRASGALARAGETASGIPNW